MSRTKRRQARTSSAPGEGPGGSEGPPPRSIGAASIAAGGHHLFLPLPFHCTLLPVQAGSCAAAASLGLCFAEMHVNGEMRRLVFLICSLSLFCSYLPWLATLQADWLLLVRTKPQQSSDSCILSPLWDLAWRRDHEGLAPCFVNRAPPLPPSFAVGRGIEVARNYVCIILLSYLSELAQELLYYVKPPRGRVTQVCRDDRVSTAPSFRKSSKP